MDISSKIAVCLDDLMKWEYFVFKKEIIPKRRVSTIMAGRQESKLRGRGLDFEEVRKYVPGDDIRNIDWKVTARTLVTHSKVFTEEKEKPAFALVDQSTSMFFGSTLYTKSVIAAQLSALHAFRAIKFGDCFGGMVFNDTDWQEIKPHRSRKTTQIFLNHVVSYNLQLLQRKKLTGQKDRFNEVLFKLKNIVTHDYTLSIISDFSNCNTEAIKSLISLSRHNDLILLHITDPFEIDLPEEKLLLSDGNYQIQWNSKKKKLREKYMQSFIDKSQQLKEMAMKYRMVYLVLSTHKPLEDQLKEVFR